MYCGNNKLHPDLINKNKIVGTPYLCFKKGIGVGKNIKTNYIIPYEPLMKNNIYCGNDMTNPKIGTLSQCLQKGYGVGLAQRKPNEELNTKFSLKNIIIIVCITIFVLLVIYFIYKKSREKKGGELHRY